MTSGVFCKARGQRRLGVGLKHEIQELHLVAGRGRGFGHHAGAVGDNRSRVAVAVGGDDQDVHGRSPGWESPGIESARVMVTR